MLHSTWGKRSIAGIIEGYIKPSNKQEFFKPIKLSKHYVSVLHWLDEALSCLIDYVEMIFISLIVPGLCIFDLRKADKVSFSAISLGYEHFFMSARKSKIHNLLFLARFQSFRVSRFTLEKFWIINLWIL